MTRKKRPEIFAFTDYPIDRLGDDKFKLAPIRECQIIWYDQKESYCKVKVFDDTKTIETKIKPGFLYEKYGRLLEVPWIAKEKLLEVIKTKEHK